ncbi:MAG: type I restriction-modification system subunit M N-terminal domain-containing protein, partial [Acidobacteria bacterium]|nr:type I restriction-modification system subunit M N-terminal domain-containing protein [Acidobacteriota bacterium]
MEPVVPEPFYLEAGAQLDKTNDKTLDIILGKKQPRLPAEQSPDEPINISSLGGWLWDVSRTLQGEIEPSKLRDFIFPLILYKRLSDLFEDFSSQANKGDETDREISSTDYLERDRTQSKGNFYIPPQFNWKAISVHLGPDLGYFMNEAMRVVARENPSLQGILDAFDYHKGLGEQGLVDNSHLVRVVSALSYHRLGEN